MPRFSFPISLSDGFALFSHGQPLKFKVADTDRGVRHLCKMGRASNLHFKINNNKDNYSNKIKGHVYWISCDNRQRVHDNSV